MIDLKIRVLGDPILRDKASEVEEFDEKLCNTIEKMQDLMVKAEGVGLAAPQVGIPLRFFVARLGDRTYSIINPCITAHEGQVVDEEGCLSLPGEYGLVNRWEWIRLEARDERGEDILLEVEGLLARIFQHEMDHLDGRLIIDIMEEKKDGA